jgi:hypothetical protein
MEFCDIAPEQKRKTPPKSEKWEKAKKETKGKKT